MSRTRWPKVLSYVNRVRREQGAAPLARLPKGALGDAWHCPIAAALCDAVGGDVEVTESSIHVEGTLLDDALPIEVMRFIEDFDAGKFPELVAA